MKLILSHTMFLIIATSTFTASALELTPQQMASVKLSTTKVIERQTTAAVAASGMLRADQQRLFRVAPVVDGIVVTLDAVEHALVRKGQVLARLHSNALGQVQADYLEAMARFDVAKAEQLRIKSLRDDGVVAESRLLEVSSQFKTAQAIVDQRRRALTLAGLSAAQINNIAQHPEDIAAYSLISPADGVMLEVSAENGQMLAAGETAFRLADLSVVWADIRVPVASIGQVAIGSKIVLKVAALPQHSFPGQLQSFSGEVDAASQTVVARVVVDNRQGLLRPGMYLQAQVQGVAQKGLMVPESAVFRRGSDIYVFKVSGPRSYEPVKVIIGEPMEGWVQVKSGLESGAEIVNGGVAELKSHWQYQGGE